MTPDFDPTVFLAALTAGPIIAAAVFFGMKMHYDEVRTGLEPTWSGLYIFGCAAAALLLALAATKFWFAWNLMCILTGVFLTVTGTYLAGRWLSLRLEVPKRPQHPETDG